MAAIGVLKVRVKTGSKGTNGRVYAGVAGREFRLDREVTNDFRANKDETYQFGGSAENVRHDDINNPLTPRLDSDFALALPAYIRFEPLTNLDEVAIDVAQITLNPGGGSNERVVFDAFYLHDQAGIVNELMLGMDTGLFCYLRRSAAPGNSPLITQITARVRTRSEGTNGFVYLGIAGREFCLNHTGSDFGADSDTIFTLGTGSFLKKKELNDPTKPRLRVADLETHPTYIRYEPRVSGDEWRLDLVEVTVNPAANANAVRYRATLLDKESAFDRAITLGQAIGKTCHLRRL